MLTIAYWVVVLFGVFLIGVGILMLFAPITVWEYIRKAGSTNFINYFEITVRMIPAAAMVIYADLSRFPIAFKLLGWFMIATSLVLYLVPRRLHHRYALWCADLLKPALIRLTSPFSILFGCAVIYSATRF